MSPTQPIDYTNRLGKTYYLFQGKTKKGNPRYFFSPNPAGAKAECVPLDRIPEGYELFEHPNSNVDPPVWRRFVVPPDIALQDLHEVIQDVMGWDGEHLHSFVIGKKRSERKSYLPARGCDGPDDFPEEDYVLKDLAYRPGMKIL